MSAKAQWIDEYTLLCERCGYVLEGLPREGKCPECGKPILESVPEARTGTAWELSPGWKGWARTMWGTLRAPLRTFGVARVEGQSSRRLQERSIFVGALLPTLIAIGAWASDAWHDERFGLELMMSVELSLVGWGFLCFVLATLTIFKGWGLRVLGNLCGWRITADVARTVCAHASAGWVVCVLVGSVVVSAWLIVERCEFGTHRFRRAMENYADAAPATTVIAGLLVFEVLVYIGVRRCRFANRRRPGP